MEVDDGDLKISVINLSSESLRDPVQRLEEAEKLVDALTTLGICYVDGMEGYKSKDLMNWTIWFFEEVSEATRLSQLATNGVNPSNPNLRYGYSPYDHDKPAWNEDYYIGPDFASSSSSSSSSFSTPKEFERGSEDDRNPFYEDTPRLKIAGREKEVKGFYETLYEQSDVVQTYSKTVMSLIGEAGGEGPGFFNSFPTWLQFKPTKYPARGAEDDDDIPAEAYVEDGRVIGSRPHQDSGLIDVVDTFGQPGLDILLGDEGTWRPGMSQLDKGTWRPVPPREGAVLVIVGEQLEMMSNGRFKAAVHRVALKPGQVRYSLPFATFPALEADMKKKIPKSLLGHKDDLSNNERRGHSYYPFGAHYLRHLPDTARYKRIEEALPQWMRKKYLDDYEEEVVDHTKL